MFIEATLPPPVPFFEIDLSQPFEGPLYPEQVGLVHTWAEYNLWVTLGWGVGYMMFITSPGDSGA